MVQIFYLHLRWRKVFFTPCGGAPDTHYTQDIHCNIPNNWVARNSLSGYMYSDGWHKSMDLFVSICCYSPLNSQVIFYDGHDIYFDDRELNIHWRHHIQSFILKAGDSVHDHPNNNSPNTKLNNLYGNTRMNWMSNHGTLNFTPPHMNYVIVDI